MNQPISMLNRAMICTLAFATAWIGFEAELVAQPQRLRTTSESDSPAPQGKAEDAKANREGTAFLKLVRDEAGVPESLRTAITRYRSPDDKLLVDLIAVIHVGEKEYYKKLAHQFTQYESLLYELVAPAGNQIPTRSKQEGLDGNPLRLIQSAMQNLLGLHSQLDHIDYTKSNFVHADLSPSQLNSKLQERGETPWTFALKALTEVMQQHREAATSPNEFVHEFQSFDQFFSLMSDSTKLKRLLASQFAAGGGTELGLGKSLHQLLITDRNEAAMRVLQGEIDKGKTRLALFYGAAHMPDFEKRLTKQLGLRKKRQVWVEAWDLRGSTDNSDASDPVHAMADLLFQLLDGADK